MSDALQQARSRLLAIREELIETSRIQNSLSDSNPEFAAHSSQHWQQHEDLRWIHARSTIPFQLLYASPECPSSTELAADRVPELIRDIGASERDTDFSGKKMPPIEGNETVKEYFERCVTEMARGKYSSKRSRELISAIEYCRPMYCSLERLLPSEREVLPDEQIVLRRRKNRQYPLPVETVSEIVQALVDDILTGRPNACRGRMQLLGFLWVCLAASQLGCEVRIKDLHCLPSSAVSAYGSGATLQIPVTDFGRSVAVSLKLGEFLLSLSELPSQRQDGYIIKSDLAALRRHLRSTIDRAGLKAILGDITLESFLIQPHFGGRGARPGSFSI